MKKERAIEVIKNFLGINLGFLSDEEFVAIELAIKALEERKQGEWQPISEGNRHECNKCKDYAPSFKDGSEHLTKFCPNCGADMRNPNCVTCDHFGKCEGCERSGEE